MKALIIVDMQKDFCPGGALAVLEGDTIVEGINQVAQQMKLVVTTQDWHPADHGSFASNNPGVSPYDMGTLSGRPQIMWPDHCVQGSDGAEFHPELSVDARNFVKGTRCGADSYSGFFDDDGTSTGLDEYLKSQRVTTVLVCGLATDYCVKFTALDALKLGYETVLIQDLCKGVNISPNDSQKALDALKEAGASIVTANTLSS